MLLPQILLARRDLPRALLMLVRPLGLLRALLSLRIMWSHAALRRQRAAWFVGGLLLQRLPGAQHLAHRAVVVGGGGRRLQWSSFLLSRFTRGPFPDRAAVPVDQRFPVFANEKFPRVVPGVVRVRGGRHGIHLKRQYQESQYLTAVTCETLNGMPGSAQWLGFRGSGSVVGAGGAVGAVGAGGSGAMVGMNWWPLIGWHESVGMN